MNGLEASGERPLEELQAARMIMALTRIGQMQLFPSRQEPLLNDQDAFLLIHYAKKEGNYHFLRMVSEDARFNAYFSQTMRDAAGDEVEAAIGRAIDIYSKPGELAEVLGEPGPKMRRAKLHYYTWQFAGELERMLDDDIPEEARGRARAAIERLVGKRGAEEIKVPRIPEEMRPGTVPRLGVMERMLLSRLRKLNAPKAEKRIAKLKK